LIKKILFISHDASRTGAPIALIIIIRELIRHLGVKADILLKETGPLVDEFKALGNVFIYPNQPRQSLTGRVVNKLLHLNLQKQKRIVNFLKKEDYDLIYANTAASSDLLLEIVKGTESKAVLHVHELKIMIKHFCGQDAFFEASKQANKIFAVSGLVESMLINDFKIDSRKVIKVYEPVAHLAQTDNKKSFNAPFLVAGSGTLDWRKGTDLFLAVIKHLNTTYPLNNISFIWVGGDFTKQEYDIIKNDLLMSNMTEKLIITGTVPNPRSYFQNANAFLLTSREDPFPLVCLENAYEGNPILCFKQSTGISEFIDTSNGLAVDFMDISALAAEVYKLSTEWEYYKAKSDNIRNLSANFSPSLVCKPIIEGIMEVMKN
jgi:glycosyltransferase involved in cell wall biosynthesis